jgi:ABC-type glycerol-3-phosphate transport system substrate-binding protein
MFVRESWLVGYMKKNAPGVQYAAAPLPAGKKTNTLLFWTNLYVTRSSKQPKEAGDFVMFMANGPKLKELEQILYNTVGWMPPRNDVQKRHPNIYTEVPQYKYFAEVPKTYELYAYPRLAVTDEAFTKLAERLVKAYQDKSLLDNPAGIAKVIHEAAEETNGILKENKLYCGK